MSTMEKNVATSLFAVKLKGIHTQFCAALVVHKKLLFPFVIIIHLFLAYYEIVKPRVFNNVTPSMPLGKYIEVKNKVIKTGDIVVFSGSEIDITVGNEKNVDFVKIVAALSGDYLVVSDSNIAVNTTVLINEPFLTYEKKHHHGIKKFYFNDFVPEGFAFLYTNHPDSYDSRYFGFVAENKLIAVVKK